MLNNNIKIIGKRNPVISLTSGDKEFRIQTIGDPHLGRNYRNNLKNRLGDREKMIRQSFLDLLEQPADITIIMGDLFDKVSITNEWFSSTVKSLTFFAEKYPNRKLIVLNGNHDLTKDVSRVSSFNLLENYFRVNDNYPNIIFLSELTDHMYLEEFNTTLCFTNYDPFNSLDDLNLPQIKFFDKVDSYKIAFGHFEVESFESNKFIDRTVPNILLDNFDLVVTGHIHKPELTEIRDTTILVTGSMQPYAFGEEIKDDGDLYVNLSLKELKEILEQNPDAFINSNVRVFYNKGEDLIGTFNCLSILYKMNPSETVLPDIAPDHAPASFSSLFLDSLKNRKTDLNTDFIESLEKTFLEKTYESD